MSNGRILYRGPSSIDGGPIVVVMTGFERLSRNCKTGPVLQTWTLRSDIDPIKAMEQGKDKSTCGSCSMRWNKGGSCYVLLHTAPLQIFRKFKEGGYPRLRLRDVEYAKARAPIRLGAYGEVTAVPDPKVITQFMVGDNHIGYTSSWRTCRQSWRKILMASVRSPKEAERATGKGWRYFRMKREGEPLLGGEIYCPHEKTSCAKCLLCRGQAYANGGLPNIAIDVHGVKAGRF